MLELKLVKDNNVREFHISVDSPEHLRSHISELESLAKIWEDEMLIEEMSTFHNDHGELTEIKVNTNVFSNITIKDGVIMLKKVKE